MHFVLRYPGVYSGLFSGMVTTNTFSDGDFRFDFSAFQLGGSAAFEKAFWIPIARARGRRTFGHDFLRYIDRSLVDGLCVHLFPFFSDANFLQLMEISVSSWPPE